MRLLAVWVAVWLFATCSAFAQTRENPRVELSQDEADKVTRPLRDTTGSAVVRLPEIAVSFTGSKGEKKVEGRFGIAAGPLTWDGKVEGPVAEGEPDTNLVTLDGVSGGASFDTGLSYLRWKPSADPVAQRRICLEYHRGRAKDLAEAKKVGTEGAPLVCAQNVLPTESYQYQYRIATSDTRAKEVCRQYALSILVDPADFRCIEGTLPEVSLREQWMAPQDWSTPFAVGGRWMVGRKKFKWADSATADLMSESETPWQVALGANVMLPRQIVLSVEYRHQSDYEEEAKRQVCQSLVGGGGASTCREVPFGKYKKAEREVGSLVARKWWGDVAVDVRYSFDFEHSDHYVEVPVYFLKVDTKGLTGGIAAGWTSKIDSERPSWSVRAFVGDILNIWPGW